MLVMVFVHVTLEQHEASWITYGNSYQKILSLEKENSIMQRDTILLSPKENIIFGSFAGNRDKNGSNRVKVPFLTQACSEVICEWPGKTGAD